MLDTENSWKLRIKICIAASCHLASTCVTFWFFQFAMAEQTPAPSAVPDCTKCGSLAAPARWDPDLGLWRAKCTKVFIVARTGGKRKSPHEAFSPLAFSIVSFRLFSWQFLHNYRLDHKIEGCSNDEIVGFLHCLGQELGVLGSGWEWSRMSRTGFMGYCIGFLLRLSQLLHCNPEWAVMFTGFLFELGVLWDFDGFCRYGCMWKGLKWRSISLASNKFMSWVIQIHFRPMDATIRVGFRYEFHKIPLYIWPFLHIH